MGYRFSSLPLRSSRPQIFCVQYIISSNRSCRIDFSIIINYAGSGFTPAPKTSKCSRSLLPPTTISYWFVFLYTGRKISARLSYVTVRGQKGGGGSKTPYAIAWRSSRPSPYLGWLATNVCICNGQRSSKISCDKYTCFGILFVSHSLHVF
jgi:hypothetical protein